MTQGSGNIRDFENQPQIPLPEEASPAPTVKPSAKPLEAETVKRVADAIGVPETRAYYTAPAEAGGEGQVELMLPRDFEIKQLAGLGLSDEAIATLTPARAVRWLINETALDQFIERSETSDDLVADMPREQISPTVINAIKIQGLGELPPGLEKATVVCLDTPMHNKKTQTNYEYAIDGIAAGAASIFDAREQEGVAAVKGETVVTLPENQFKALLAGLAETSKKVAKAPPQEAPAQSQHAIEWEVPAVVMGAVATKLLKLPPVEAALPDKIAAGVKTHAQARIAANSPSADGWKKLLNVTVRSNGEGTFIMGNVAGANRATLFKTFAEHVKIKNGKESLPETPAASLANGQGHEKPLLRLAANHEAHLYSELRPLFSPTKGYDGLGTPQGNDGNFVIKGCLNHERAKDQLREFGFTEKQLGKMIFNADAKTLTIPKEVAWAAWSRLLELHPKKEIKIAPPKPAAGHSPHHGGRKPPGRGGH